MRWSRVAGAVIAAVIIGDLAWVLPGLRSRFADWQARGRTGFVSRTHDDGSRYVVFTPHERRQDETLPLIVFLNGVGENGDDGVKQISNNFGSAVWELKACFPFAILATQCRVDGEWSPDSDDTRRLLEVLDRTIAEYSIDPDRVSLTGPSAGGNGTWRLGAAFADRFAAIVPLASGGCDMPEADAVTAYAAVNMPVWSFCNRGDAGDLVEFNRRMHAQLVAAGLDARLTDYDTDGHDCWTDAYRTPALYHWLWQRSRKSRSRQSKYRPLFDIAPLSEWTGALGVAHLEGDVLIVNETSELVSQRAFGDVEVRLEFLCDAPERLELILLSQGTGASECAEIRGVIDWPQYGSGGFVVEEDRWIGVGEPVAQRCLACGHWNDLQLVLHRGRLALRVNGLLLSEAELPEELHRKWRIGFTMHPAHRFRSLRWRPLTAQGD